MKIFFDDFLKSPMIKAFRVRTKSHLQLVIIYSISRGQSYYITKCQSIRNLNGYGSKLDCQFLKFKKTYKVVNYLGENMQS